MLYDGCLLFLEHDQVENHNYQKKLFNNKYFRISVVQIWLYCQWKVQSRQKQQIMQNGYLNYVKYSQKSVRRRRNVIRFLQILYVGLPKAVDKVIHFCTRFVNYNYKSLEKKCHAQCFFYLLTTRWGNVICLTSVMKYRVKLQCFGCKCQSDIQ